MGPAGWYEMTAGKRQRISVGGPPEILDHENRGLRQRPMKEDGETPLRVEQEVPEMETNSHFQSVFNDKDIELPQLV